MSPRARRSVLLTDIDVLVDVGANAGQFAEWIRRLGFRGRIVSFEPTRRAYSRLQENSARDGAWECHRLALGERREEAEIHVAAEPVASSFLVPTPATVAAAPGMASSTTERVSVARLDEVWCELIGEGKDRCYLKVDVEGYELSVLGGAEKVLGAVRLLELELSLCPVYENGPLLVDVVKHLSDRGYSVVSLEPNQGLDDGQIMMMDCIFRRDGLR
jgi:FkbM family methyltransferase